MRAERSSRPRWDPVLAADRLTMSLALASHRVTLPLARAARRFLEARGWCSFGYARLEDHARERFGRSSRWVRDLGALAEAIERLPALARAIGGEDGARPIGCVQALLIGRAASVETCDEWISKARAVTVRELREEIRRAREAGSSRPMGDVCADPDRGIGSDAEKPCSPVRDDEPESDERCTIRLPVPAPVRAAFDEAHDLYGAVSGGGASLSSFVEALVADAYAGPSPPLEEFAPIGRRPDQASREHALAVASDGWCFLRAGSSERGVFEEAEGILVEVERVCGAAEASTWDPETLIRSLINLSDQIERRLGELLAVMGESGAWGRLQFSGVGHYGEERLGISRRSAEERARLARLLRRKPLVREAYHRGRIRSAATTLVLRALGEAAVDARLEAAWVGHAGGISIKRLRDEIRLLGRGAAAGSRSTTAPPPSDSAWHASLSRRPGDAIARVARFKGLAAEAPLDLVRFSLRLPIELAGDLLAAVSTKRLALEESLRGLRGGEPVSDTDDSESSRSARMFSNRSTSLPEWVGLLGLIEDFVATWDDPWQSPKRQSDRVYIRDGWRCSAPGCTSMQNLEDHHIVYRSRGGTDELSNRITLCRFHHQQGEHGGLMECRGTAPLGILWRLGHRGKGGRFRNERDLLRLVRGSRLEGRDRRPFEEIHMRGVGGTTLASVSGTSTPRTAGL